MFAIILLAKTSCTKNKMEEPMKCCELGCLQDVKSHRHQPSMNGGIWLAMGNSMEGLSSHLPWSRSWEAHSQTHCQSFSGPLCQSQSAGRCTLLPSGGTVSGFLAEAPVIQTCLGKRAEYRAWEHTWTCTLLPYPHNKSLAPPFSLEMIYKLAVGGACL